MLEKEKKEIVKMVEMGNSQYTKPALKKKIDNIHFWSIGAIVFEFFGINLWITQWYKGDGPVNIGLLFIVPFLLAVIVSGVKHDRIKSEIK
jgi:hypothetical protein